MASQLRNMHACMRLAPPSPFHAPSIAADDTGAADQVQAASGQFLSELGRHNYVTPTSYLELLAAFKGLLVEIEGPPAGATSMDQLASGNPTVPALIAQLATLPHLGAPRSAIADGRLVLVIPETGAPRVFDPPSQPGARLAAPHLARIRQVLGAVLHVADALAAPTQA